VFLNRRDMAVSWVELEVSKIIINSDTEFTYTNNFLHSKSLMQQSDDCIYANSTENIELYLVGYNAV
jgi:hypothetical protein